MSELQQVEQPQRRLHILTPGGESGVDRLPRLYDVQEKGADDKSLARSCSMPGLLGGIDKKRVDF